MSALSQDKELRKQVWHPHIVQLVTELASASAVYKKELDRRLC